MSGRSGFVRKEQRSTKGANIPKDEGVIEYRSSSQLSAYTRRTGSSDSPPGSFGLQIRSVPDYDPAYARVRRPNTSNIESNIEKSALRLALDAQSDQIRHTIGDLFAGKSKAKNFQQEPKPQNHNSFRSIPELEGDSEFENGTPRIQPRVELEAKSPPPDAPLPKTPSANKLRKFAGPSTKDATFIDSNSTDADIWIKGADVLIFLTPESPTGPTGIPSFKVPYQTLTGFHSLVLETLLDENERKRQSMVDFSKVVLSLMTNPELAKQLTEEQRNDDYSDVKYTITLAPPKELNGEVLGRYVRGTRNALAVLNDLPLVGDDFFEMLNGTFERLKEWTDGPTKASQLMRDYVKNNLDYGLMNVRYDPKAAVGLLAFSELEEVKFASGYREGFVHSVGMLVDGRILAHHLTILKPVTKRLLNDHYLRLKTRIESCARQIAGFNFLDMWPTVVPGDSEEAHQAFKETMQFFRSFYERQIRNWPSNNPTDGSWLTRNVVRELQTDFAFLYDFLVDRSVHFQPGHIGKRWDIVHRHSSSFFPNSDGVRMTEILATFDDKRSFPHIPHPFPLLPKSIPVTTPEKVADVPKTKNPFKLIKNDKKERKKAALAVEQHTQSKAMDQIDVNNFHLAYSDASNLVRLQERYTGNDLVEAFLHFEQNSRVLEVDPRIVRRGRWIAIYGILQCLATLSVDVPNILYSDDGINYFLNTGVNGLPPWSKATAVDHQMSPPFFLPKTWIDHWNENEEEQVDQSDPEKYKDFDTKEEVDTAETAYIDDTPIAQFPVQITSPGANYLNHAERFAQQGPQRGQFNEEVFQGPGSYQELPFRMESRHNAPSRPLPQQPSRSKLEYGEGPLEAPRPLELFPQPPVTHQQSLPSRQQLSRQDFIMTPVPASTPAPIPSFRQRADVQRTPELMQYGPDALDFSMEEVERINRGSIHPLRVKNPGDPESPDLVNYPGPPTARRQDTHTPTPAHSNGRTARSRKQKVKFSLGPDDNSLPGGSERSETPQSQRGYQTRQANNLKINDWDNMDAPYRS